MLRRWAAGGRVAHAYLFTGPPGMGKLETALELAKLLNCEHPEGDGFCGRCPACRRIDGGAHPEVRVIAPEGSTTRIAQVRAVCREACLRPALGRRRVFIFQDADRLTPEAANALLTTLEEPPAHLVLVLLANHTQAVLPTVLSRCHHLAFRPWPEAMLAGRLEAEGIDSGRARLAAALSQGNPGVARGLLAGELGPDREEVERTLERLARGQACKPHSLAGDLEAYTRDRSGTLVFLDLLLFYLRDFLVWKVSGRRGLLINRDRADWIGVQAGGRSPGHLLQALGTAAYVREVVRQNGQRRLCLYLLVLRLAGALGGNSGCPGS